MRRLSSFAAVALALAMAAPARAGDAVVLHAAGSLRAAMTDLIGAFESEAGDRVEANFGASGLLKDAIAGGAKADVFASANMEHPAALARARRGGPPVLFARNRLCALVRPGVAAETATLLDRMLDPAVKLGTSTPRADPSGDYAWDVFRKAERIEPGAYATLDRKALQLTGGSSSPAPPPGRTIYGMLVAQGDADIFLTYCTNARAAQQEFPEQRIVALPDALAVGADYGLTVMVDAAPAAYRFALFILSAEGQRILVTHGFAAPGLPP
jgi:ABC-type molybdate transport system substrate-binding protein